MTEIADHCAVSGANQLLFIVDTCFSGEALPAASVAAEVLHLIPADGPHVWVGVLTSSTAAETAQDGLLGQRLRALLETGPSTPVLRLRWSVHNEFVRGDDLCDAVVKEWDSDRQTPQFQGRGSAWWIFRNPLYDPGAPDQVVEHLLLAARGGQRTDERSWFTGRTVEVNQVVSWVRAGQPGVYVVTGSAGTGKSAILGRVVSLSNPDERRWLRAAGTRWDHDDPGEGSVHAHVHARALTADRAAELIDGQLIRRGVLVAQEGRRNAAELIGHLQRAVEAGTPPPVVLVDGVDEARGEAFGLAEELLPRLARYAVVVVSTRDLSRGDDKPGLVATLALDGAGLDLDAADAQRRTREDLHDYVRARLAEVDPEMDPALIAEHLTGIVAGPDARSSPFLLARLVTDQLRATPVDTSHDGWQQQIAGSIEDAFRSDLAEIDPPPHRPLAEHEAVTAAARALLAALTWGYGAGLPEEEWLAVANAGEEQPPGGYGRDDLTWLLDQLGRYIVQDGEAGVAVYRIAHQSLADQLRPPHIPHHQGLFDPQALPVADALTTRYRTLLGSGVPAPTPGYLWRYLWRHAAAAGPSGLDLLRELARADQALTPDVAMADLTVAHRLQEWGHRHDAVAPTEEAVTVYRELAATNPAFLPDLASALNNLGIRYREVGDGAAADAPWQRVLADAPPSDAAYLLLSRASAAQPAEPAAVEWLAQAITLAGDDRELIAALHEQPRRHRNTDPEPFDAGWYRRTGAVPEWLTLDTDLVATATAWIRTATYPAERDHLAAHPELLRPDADGAVAEALLPLDDRHVRRYTALRDAARAEGVAAAYRPLLLTVLAREFSAADPTDQAALLAERRDDLLTDIVRTTVAELAQDDSAGAATRAHALLTLAEADGAESALEALSHPARFPDLLDSLSRQPDSAALRPTAILAWTVAATKPDAATAGFYLAVATASAGDLDQAAEILTDARRLDPDQTTTWITRLAAIGVHHPAVLPLISTLTATLDDPPAGGTT